MVSKRGLEPLRPFERQPLKLVRLPISPLRRGNTFDLISETTGLSEKDAQCNDRHHPDKGKNHSDAIQVSFGRRGPKRGRSSATEHVTQATAAPTMQKNSNDHGRHRHDIDHNRQGGH